MLLALLIGFFLSRDIARTAGQVATAAKGLAVGDLNQQITIHSRDELGQMADAVRSMIAYQHEMAEVARAMATGDLTRDVKPKGAHDVLGIAFGRMTANLRTLVSDLQQQTATLSGQAQLLELANDAIIVRDFETDSVQFWNRGAQQVYGWTAADAFGQRRTTLTGHPVSRLQIGSGRGTAPHGRWDGEHVHTRQNGTQLVMLQTQAVQRDHTGYDQRGAPDQHQHHRSQADRRGPHPTGRAGRARARHPGLGPRQYDRWAGPDGRGPPGRLLQCPGSGDVRDQCREHHRQDFT